MKELVDAIYNLAVSDADLDGVIESDIYFGEAKRTATMPWVVYHFIADNPVSTFEDDNTTQVTVQFSMFDKRKDVQHILDIDKKLKAAFDRATLTYDNHTHIGCMRTQAAIGPQWFGDAWMKTVDYLVTFKN